MNEMMEMVMGFEGMKKGIKHIPGPEGVRGRNSDNKLILEKLGWEPTIKLQAGGGGALPTPARVADGHCPLLQAVLLAGLASSEGRVAWPGCPGLPTHLPGWAMCRTGCA